MHNDGVGKQGGWRRWVGAELPSWLVPVLLCGWAIIGALQLAVRFNDQLGGLGAGEETVAGPNLADGLDLSGGETPSGLERSPDAGNATGIGALPDHDQVWVHPRSTGLPWSAIGAVDGLLTFRGNPTRTFHGRGPIPVEPTIGWRREIGCSESAVGSEPKTWCGTGWTGQPSVFPAPVAPGSEDDGSQEGGLEFWVGVGGYNQSVNFFDPASGANAYPPFETGDIIKGSITVDPDGFPLVYTGSRDDYYHIAAIDRPRPTELWRLSADDAEQTLWNNDWDSSGMIVGDHLFIGGENSRFYVVKLNRGYDDEGLVTVDPEVVFSAEGWDDELLAAVGDDQVSIENSIAVSGTVAYFANSGGLVQGWDFAGIEDGIEPRRVFRFWTGDDTDASVIIDEEGMLYLGSQFERGTARSRQLGQIFKLDPSKPDDPLVWSQPAASGLNAGIWATPGLFQDLVIVPTHEGQVLALDRATGEQRWVIELPGPLWSSPTIVDGVLIQGDCDGTLHAFDLTDTSSPPPKLWSIELDGCIESTPAVWQGRIFVGTRSGSFFAIEDAAG